MPLGYALSRSLVMPTPQHRATQEQACQVTDGVGLTPEALSVREKFHLSVSEYEISGMDTGWVRFGPGAGASDQQHRLRPSPTPFALGRVVPWRKRERLLHSGDEGPGRKLGALCPTPRPVLARTGHSLGIGTWQGVVGGGGGSLSYSLICEPASTPYQMLSGVGTVLRPMHISEPRTP